MRVDTAKLPRGWRGEECQDCGNQWIAVGPDQRSHPEWRGCKCGSKNVRTMRGPSRKKNR